jgi:predicted phosphodiesterase
VRSVNQEIIDAVKLYPQSERDSKMVHDLALKFDVTRRTIRGYRERLKKIDFEYKNKEVLCLGDVHSPYHDIRSLHNAIEYVTKYHNISRVVLLGDFCDFFEVSHYARTPEQHFDEEIEADILLLENLKSWFPDIEITYIEGNHENRLTRYIQSKAPALTRIYGVEIPQILELKRLDIDYVRNVDLMEQKGEPFKIGNLHYLHGHEVLGGGVMVARTKFMKVQQNIIFGHHHTVQNYMHKQLNDFKGSWAVGCMCTVAPSYMSIGNQHIQGFAVVDYDRDGDFTVNNKIVIGDKIK